ncbi:hypothetical protein IVA77_21925 [Bradyrhizobium sp. 136]|uniref:hypothetical protein n=1 Tax=Bradyrhizobium sp. 163 TaxID=2782636 RepID=UPI001FFBFEFF|nr:hypothetical protein [Bradyrhizobium sp. 163]MCK1764144.1 hypothetical protein [Bradyrhizobium sp. 136]
MALIRIERNRAVIVKIGLRDMDAVKFGGEHLFHLKVPSNLARIPKAGHSYGARDKTVNLDEKNETYLPKMATQRLKTSNGRAIIT